MFLKLKFDDIISVPQRTVQNTNNKKIMTPLIKQVFVT